MFNIYATGNESARGAVVLNLYVQELGLKNKSQWKSGRPGLKSGRPGLSLDLILSPSGSLDVQVYVPMYRDIHLDIQTSTGTSI